MGQRNYRDSRPPSPLVPTLKAFPPQMICKIATTLSRRTLLQSLAIDVMSRWFLSNSLRSLLFGRLHRHLDHWFHPIPGLSRQALEKTQNHWGCHKWQRDCKGDSSVFTQTAHHYQRPRRNRPVAVDGSQYTDDITPLRNKKFTKIIFRKTRGGQRIHLAEPFKGVLSTTFTWSLAYARTLKSSLMHLRDGNSTEERSLIETVNDKLKGDWFRLNTRATEASESCRESDGFSHGCIQFLIQKAFA